eukprot:CAMPEP_0194489092 /NCGR_PEP_ID=MMETSP0253-20130528/8762_1 /TAXON_ID=2966 /ORGANISM="Noctiluca scintillans" /LENGTH=1111 /DNA_ID=CAMNT_0039329519 /DNA_START=37 /DNA_END=3368 /DNA_ORIENTATION=-
MIPKVVGISLACVLSLVGPVVLICISVIGLQNLESQSEIGLFWIRERSSYRADEEYASSVQGESTDSSALMLLAKPRSGGNVLTSETLLQVRDRLSKTQQQVVVVDGMTFTFQDVCSTAGEYAYECIRLTVLDCFREGEYDFGTTPQVIWESMIVSGLVSALYIPLVETGLASSFCSGDCAVDGVHPTVAALTGTASGTWATDTTCRACVDDSRSAATTDGLDALYYFVLETLIFTITGGSTPEMLQSTLGTSTKEEAMDQWTTSYITQATGISGQTPYSWMLGPTLGGELGPMGLPRPTLNDSGALMSEVDVLSTASASCWGWDEGLFLPKVNHYLTHGRTDTTLYNGTLPLAHLDAVQTYLLMRPPTAIKERLSSTAAATYRPGGAVNVTLDQAKEVLFQFKKIMEETYTGDWESSSDVLFLGWSDDVGVGGTTYRMLEEATLKFWHVALPSVCIIIVISGACFFNCWSPLSISRSCLAIAGAVLVVFTIVAAFGFYGLIDEKVNLAMTYSMPFVLGGILCDDMYMMTLSTDLYDGRPWPRFKKAMETVILPISMSTGVNLAVFATIWFMIDIPAVSQVGQSGMITTVMFFSVLMISFAPLVYLVLVCTEGTRLYEPRRQVYYPYLRRVLPYRSCHVITLGFAVVVGVVGSIGFKDFKIGLDLYDLFQDGTQAYSFIEQRMKYFPVWPVGLNWGAVPYGDPDTQLKMAWQWEQVASTTYLIPELTTTSVWTVSVAMWGISSVYGMNLCDVSNSGTSGNCAETLAAQLGEPACSATWVENTYNLKLASDGGFCYAGAEIGLESGSYCPVMEYASDADMATCLSRWSTYTLLAASTAPGYQTDDTGAPEIPIRLSSAGESVMFAHKLVDNDDYLNLIRETRQYVDDDDSIHAWMSGIPYDYWEQYLDTEQMMWEVGGWMSLAGFVAGFLFTLIHLAIGSHGTWVQRVTRALFSGLVIAALLIITHITVFGYVLLFGIKLSSFTLLSLLLSSAFAVEYSTHVVHHFLASEATSVVDRVDHAMSFLFDPMLMSFSSSMIALFPLAFSDFLFVEKFFFWPLLVVVIVTYIYGAFGLPAFLCLLPYLGPLERISAQSSQDSDAEKVQRQMDPVVA